MNCPMCNSENVNNAKFCFNCGQQLIYQGNVSPIQQAINKLPQPKRGPNLDNYVEPYEPIEYYQPAMGYYKTKNKYSEAQKVIAALLNLFTIPGIGYIVLGKPFRFFGILLFYSLCWIAAFLIAVLLGVTIVGCIPAVILLLFFDPFFRVYSVYDVFRITNN